MHCLTPFPTRHYHRAAAFHEVRCTCPLLIWLFSPSIWRGLRYSARVSASGQRNINDYFLGGRTAPWWALALSIVATETSTLTIIGTPALAYGGNSTFLQLVFGYVVGRIILAVLFIPRFFRGEFYTAYQLIERRFGARAKSAAALTFLVTRALAEGVRIAAIATVVQIAFGTGQRTSVVLILLLTLFYTWEGGMKAVIWTDVIQTFIYLGRIGGGVFFDLAQDSRRVGARRECSGGIGRQIPRI